MYKDTSTFSQLLRNLSSNVGLYSTDQNKSSFCIVEEDKKQSKINKTSMKNEAGFIHHKVHKS